MEFREKELSVALLNNDGSFASQASRCFIVGLIIFSFHFS